MDNEMMELLQEVMQNLIFHDRYNRSDCLAIFNWVSDHRSAPVYSHKNRFLTLSYCGRCGTIIQEGDRYCHQCGRELRG